MVALKFACVGFLVLLCSSFSFAHRILWDTHDQKHEHHGHDSTDTTVDGKDNIGSSNSAGSSGIGVGVGQGSNGNGYGQGMGSGSGGLGVGYGIGSGSAGTGGSGYGVGVGSGGSGTGTGTGTGGVVLIPVAGGVNFGGSMGFPGFGIGGGFGIGQGYGCACTPECFQRTTTNGGSATEADDEVNKMEVKSSETEMRFKSYGDLNSIPPSDFTVVSSIPPSDGVKEPWSLSAAKTNEHELTGGAQMEVTNNPKFDPNSIPPSD